jgi:hypothetical protein
VVWFGVNVMRMKYSKNSLNIIMNDLNIARTFLRDYFNMPYFEGGYLNIYLFNNMLQRLNEIF